MSWQQKTMPKGTILSLLVLITVQGQVASTWEMTRGRVTASVEIWEGGVHFHTSPLNLLLWVASTPDPLATELVQMPPSLPPPPYFGCLLGLGCIYCRWLWFISRCLWPGTGGLQMAPQRVGKCRHLPFCEALSRNEKDSHKMVRGRGVWRGGNTHHKKCNGLMLIRRPVQPRGVC